MRVSEQQIFDVMKGNLTRLSAQALATQTQIATGKRINQPSDDPIGFGQIVSLKGTLALVDQRLRNIGFGQTRLQTADSTLGEASTVLARIKELAVAARSDTNDAAARARIAQEVRQLQQQLVSLGNAQANGQYVFAGTKTDQPPFLMSAGDVVTYQGNDEIQSVQVGEGETVQTTVPGSQIFSGPTSNTFTTIKNLLASLETNDVAGIEAGIGGLDTGLTQVTDAQGRIGALENRLDSTTSSLQGFKQNATTALSGVEDADLTQTLTEFSQQQLAFQAAAQTASRIFDSTLLRFLGPTTGT